MAFVGEHKEIVTLVGTGTGIVSAVIFGTKSRGTLTHIIIREPLVGGANATEILSMAFVHNIDQLTFPAVAAPPDEHLVALVENVLLTPSATDADFRTHAVHPESFSGGLGVIANVTAAAGAFELKLGLKIENFTDPTVDP